MQQQATYEKEDAENIIRDYLNGWVEWRDDGLFIKQGMLENDPSGSVFHWTPACYMEWDGAPDQATAPSLPFPFTANQLAAFMLNGIGATVARAYGAWEDGPGEAAMDEAMGIRARRAREALRKAFSLYREAEKVVGELAPEVWNERLPIHPSILRAQGKELALQATLKHLSWCRDMTRQLLQPQATTPSPAPAPQATPVVATMKKKALIDALEYEWPTIRKDLSEATRNGLKDAAHAGNHGDWNKDKARAWAVSKGKIKQAAPLHIWPGLVTRHTIDDE